MTPRRVADRIIDHVPTYDALVNRHRPVTELLAQRWARSAGFTGSADWGKVAELLMVFRAELMRSVGTGGPYGGQVK